MATLDSLLVRIDASTELLRRELQKGGVAVDGFARNTERRLGGFETRFSKMGATLRSALGALGVGFSTQAVVNFTRGAIQAADAIGETARAAGFGAERFQRLSFVFRQNGLNAQEFDAAMRTLNTRLGQFITTGGGPAAKALDELGLKQRVLSGELRTSEQLFDAIVASLEQVGSSSERAAIAAAFFGREAGAKMQDALSRGTDALNDAAAAATGIFSDDTVRKADQLADAWERIAAAAGKYFRSSAVNTAYGLGQIAGIDELQPTATENAQRRVRELENQLQFLTGERPGVAAGANRDRRRAEVERELAALRANANYEQLLTAPFVTGRASAAAPNDGLSEISTDYGRLPAEMQRVDFGGFAEAIRNSELQEVAVVINKMPDDLQRLSPEFNKAVASLQNYNSEVNKAAEAQREMVDFIGRSLQSTLADAFMGIEVSFRDLLKRMAAELAASALTKGLMGIFGGSGIGSFFSGLFGGARANGGPVQRGKAYLVNEGKPELFWPGVSGSMVPVAQMGGGVTIHVDARGSTDPAAFEAAAYRAFAAAVQVAGAQTNAKLSAMRRPSMA
jgi:hypothetical protein